MTKLELVEKLKSIKSALIFCHARPDGDTLSSAFSLKMALAKLGAKANVVCADPIPQKYLLSGLFTKLDSDEGDFDCHISVDCASPTLMGGLYEIYRKNSNTIAIDHHVSNSRYAKFNYVVDQSANAVNMFEIISEMGVEIDETMASIIYLGVCTDTGNFSNSSTNSKAFEVGQKLVDLGANPSKIYNAMYKNQSIARAKLYLHVMSGIKFFHENKVAIITTKLKDLEKFGVDSAENEGFIDFPLSIGSVEIAIGILQKSEKSYKISFRSKEKADVNKLASVFGGGGHVRASGALINGYYEDVLDKLVFNAGNYLE